MSRIVRDIERPDPALCAALAELGVATVHEAASLARYRRGELSLDVNELRGVLKALDPDT